MDKEKLEENTAMFLSNRGFNGKFIDNFLERLGLFLEAVKDDGIEEVSSVKHVHCHESGVVGVNVFFSGERRMEALLIETKELV